MKNIKPLSIILSIFTVDGFLVVMAITGIMSIGGFLHTLLGIDPLIILLVSATCAGLVLIWVFLISLLWAYEDPDESDYPSS